jgi:hypothetical protein
MKTINIKAAVAASFATTFILAFVQMVLLTPDMSAMVA